MAKKRKNKLKSQAPDIEVQAGPRTSGNGDLNYNSVTTLAPRRLAAAFTEADNGNIVEQAKLYELIEEQDSHIFSELAKRRRAVTGLGWHLAPPKDADESEIKRTAELEEMVRSIPRIEDAQYDITDAIGKGFSALEMEWKFGDEWLPKQIHFVPQRHFEIVKETAEMLYLNDGVAEPLKANAWIIHEHRAKSGYIEQSALFRVLAWTYAYKTYNVKDMQRFLETYGMPLRLGKYPSGISKEQRNELLKAVRNIGNDGAGVVPANMLIEFVEAKAKGNVADFLSAIEYWENKQSKAILGGDLDGKTTSEARIMLYDKVRREILMHDVQQIQPTLDSQLLMPINLYNGLFTPDRMPKWAYETEESVDQAKAVAVLDQAVSLGMEIDIEYAHEMLQIPKAGKGAQLLKKTSDMATETPAGEVPNKGKKDDSKNQDMLSRLAALASQQGAKASLTDAYSAQLAALGAKHEAELVQKIQTVIAENGNFDGAIAGIEALAIDFKVPALAETIAAGMTAAHLGGMSEADDEGEQ